MFLIAVLVLLATAIGVASEQVLKEKEISLEDAPEPVRETILQEAGDHEVLEVEMPQGLPLLLLLVALVAAIAVGVSGASL